MAAKVHTDMAGDQLVVEAGGSINLKTGAHVTVDSAALTAMTAQLTTITHTAPGTPDYALQDLTDTGGFGFATKDEGNSVMKVIANLQVRVAELEARLKSFGGLLT